jgi:hypothetical protein
MLLTEIERFGEHFETDKIAGDKDTLRIIDNLSSALDWHR